MSRPRFWLFVLIPALLYGLLAWWILGYSDKLTPFQRGAWATGMAVGFFGLLLFQEKCRNGWRG